MDTLNANRRKFLRTSSAVVAALSMPTIIPATALGRDGAVAPSERVNLGVIGIGPRCRYDLGAMLKFDDVRCVAIADILSFRNWPVAAPG